MATFVQGTQASDNSGATATPNVAWPGAVGAGHLLVVIANLGTNGSAYTDATCSDGRETWTKVGFKPSTGAAESIVMFIAKKSIGGSANTVTVTFTGGTLVSSVTGIALMEYAPPSGQTFNLDSSNSGGGGAATTGSPGAVAVGQSAELVVAASAQYNNPGMTWTADTADGFAFREQADVATLEVEDNLGVDVSSVTPSFTWSVSHTSWVCIGASFSVSATPDTALWRRTQRSWGRAG